MKRCNTSILLCALLLLCSCKSVAEPSIANQRVASVYAGSDVFAVMEDGTLWGWGENRTGLLGQMDGPVLAPALLMNDITDVTSNGANVFVIDKNNILWGWGTANVFLQHKEGTINAPVQLVEDVTSAYLGQYCAYVIKTDGSVWGWGYSSSLPAPESDTIDKSVQVTEPKLIMSDGIGVAQNDFGTSFLLQSDGSLWGWGNNSVGELSAGGNEGADNFQEPVRIMDHVADFSISRIDAQIIVIKDDNTAWSWGYDYSAGHVEPYNSPQQLADNAKKICAASTRTYWIDQDDNLWYWGTNLDLNGPRVPFASSILVMEDVKDIHYGGYTLIIKSDGSLYGIGGRGGPHFFEPSSDTNYGTTILLIG